jgi:hypothetical protein
VAGEPSALLVTALGLPRGDWIHLDKEGYERLGKAVGQALLAGRGGVGWPGPVLEMAVLDRHRKLVTVHFAETRKLAGADPADFRVVDKQGPLPCLKVTAANTNLALEFERPIELPAQLYYGFGPDPKASLADELDYPAPAANIEVKVAPVPEDKPTLAPNGAVASKAGALNDYKNATQPQP